jgi:hypothetical protein
MPASRNSSFTLLTMAVQHCDRITQPPAIIVAVALRFGGVTGLRLWLPEPHRWFDLGRRWFLLVLLMLSLLLFVLRCSECLLLWIQLLADLL